MNEVKNCVIGLGYVGLPLARNISQMSNTIGIDMLMGLHVQQILRKSVTATSISLLSPHRSMKSIIRI